MQIKSLVVLATTLVTLGSAIAILPVAEPVAKNISTIAQPVDKTTVLPTGIAPTDEEVSDPVTDEDDSPTTCTDQDIREFNSLYDTYDSYRNRIMDEIREKFGDDVSLTPDSSDDEPTWVNIQLSDTRKRRRQEPTSCDELQELRDRVNYLEGDNVKIPVYGASPQDDDY